MDDVTAQPAVAAERRLADVVTTIPGASAVLRAYGIDFCCRGDVSLAGAAAERGLTTAFLEARFAELERRVAEPAPDAAASILVGYVLTRFHEAHRRELPELIELARHVETVQHGHPGVPAGLTEVLQRVAEDLDLHMRKEEQMLFPMMMAGGHPHIRNPIGCMRREHEHHREVAILLDALVQGGLVPDDACTHWRALAIGLRKLVDDLMAHIRYENDVLFPRFEADPSGCAGAG